MGAEGSKQTAKSDPRNKKRLSSKPDSTGQDIVRGYRQPLPEPPEPAETIGSVPEYDSDGMDESEDPIYDNNQPLTVPVTDDKPPVLPEKTRRGEKVQSAENRESGEEYGNVEFRKPDRLGAGGRENSKENVGGKQLSSVSSAEDSTDSEEEDEGIPIIMQT